MRCKVPDREVGKVEIERARPATAVNRFHPGGSFILRFDKSWDEVSVGLNTSKTT